MSTQPRTTAILKTTQLTPEKLDQALHALLTILPEISMAMEERFANVPAPFDPSALAQLEPMGQIEQLRNATTATTSFETPAGEYCDYTHDFVVPTAAIVTAKEDRDEYLQVDVNVNGCNHSNHGTVNNTNENVNHTINNDNNNNDVNSGCYPQTNQSQVSVPTGLTSHLPNNLPSRCAV